MANTPIFNTISDDKMQKYIAENKAKSVLLPQVNSDGAYRFTKFNNALYIHSGTENFRVLDFKLSEKHNNARDIALKFTTSANFDIANATLSSCEPAKAERLTMALKNTAVNVGLGEAGYFQKPLLPSQEMARHNSQMPLPKPPAKEVKKKEEEKPKKLWDDCLKDWAFMGLQTGGGLLVMMTIIGVFPAFLAGWLFVVGLISLCFAKQIIDFGEKTVKKVAKHVKKFNDWLDYRSDLRAYKRNEKDFWANIAENRKNPKLARERKKALEAQIKEEDKARRAKEKQVEKNIKIATRQSKKSAFKQVAKQNIMKYSLKKPLGQTKTNENDLSAGM